MLFKIYFIFLVSLIFNDFYFFLNPVVFLIFLWLFFFKLNTNAQKIGKCDFIKNPILKINPNKAFINFYYYLALYIYISIYSIRGKNNIVWFNHFNINNFTIYLFYIFVFMGLIIFFFFKSFLLKKSIVKSTDYIFAINNLIIIFPYLFFVNTVFNFLFLLELISVVLLYKLISSKIWFKSKNNTTTNLHNNIPQNYINMVFFQYWVTFFSTIYIIYFYINIFYIYGTSEWFIVQFINFLDTSCNQVYVSFCRLLTLVFILSIFFKLGVTPFHLFKIEVYKGLPFLSIFFYTTYYFIVFFIFFTFLLSDLLPFFSNYYYFLLSILIFFGSVYIIVLLFDVTFLKAFFTYSTVINTIGFLVAFVAIL